uniref:PEPxxWA-CTERM sorting domain-containing protein n=1 Tax=uncultured Sphingomonas sp. TaxID=158754 RepID=UPI0035CA2869
FAGTTRSAVYRNTLGTLDFYYQVARTGGGSVASQSIDGLTVSNFLGFTVDGFVSAGDPDGGGAFTAANNPPASTTTVGRSSDGQVVQTFFGSNGLLGSDVSATYIFRTNATDFTTGTFGLINGSTFTGQAFAPAVPEPATWGMMILGFGLIGGALRRRKSTVSFA